jgi:aspartyl-tRNA synthetase
LKLDLLGDRQRTHYCGDLRKTHAGQPVFLCGWVARRRDLGNLIFLDLRDHTGVIQVVCRPEVSAEAHNKAEEARAEYVVGVEGEVVLRALETVNPQLSTGEVEVVAKTLLLLNQAKTPPFPIDDEETPDSLWASWSRSQSASMAGSVSQSASGSKTRSVSQSASGSKTRSVSQSGSRTTEETRLRYRYLDLRRGRMQHHLRLRHTASLAVRQHMSAHGFVEIETPFMTRSTPEGARDYLVPSRIYPGRFYALPQSPQLFKQILMIGGFDRYFQIVRCFRDEDFRADRQAEFTQIDVEMAFPQREVLFGIIEELMVKLFALLEVEVERPLPVLAYDAAMEKYGSDKPHLGFDLAWKRINLPESVREQIHVAEPLKALRVPGWATASRSQLDKLDEHAKTSGADWFSYIKVSAAEQVRDPGGRVQSPLAKIIGDEAIRTVAAAVNSVPGDLIVMLGLKSASSAGLETLPLHRVRQLDEASGEVRLDVARKLDLVRPGSWNFAWVVDFPMFGYDEKEGRFDPMHHPFTSPRDEDLEKLESDPASVKARAYDLVLNGSEIGGGSIRIHRQDIQKRIFNIIGLTEEKARERFGFFLDALEYGTPPHGGIALGYDRIIALMARESNIREVIAFPKTASGADLMCDAPSTVEPEQLEELGLHIAPEASKRVKCEG